MAASIAWTVALMAEPGSFEAWSVFLIGFGLLVMALVSVVGIVLVGGRWAHRLGLVTLAATLVIAAIRPIDAFWYAGLVLSAAGAASMFLPGVTSRVRKRPAAASPPWRAAAVPLILISAPFAIGVAGYAAEAWVGLVISLTAVAAALAYARVIAGGLIAARVVWPVIALSLGLTMGFPAALISVGLGITVGLLAWHPSVKVAFHPPREVGTSYPIPPELVPPDILDRARLDERGRRR